MVDALTVSMWIKASAAILPDTLVPQEVRTAEMDELFNCDHVYVFRDGQIVSELSRSELTEEKILQSSFKESA